MGYLMGEMGETSGDDGTSGAAVNEDQRFSSCWDVFGKSAPESGCFLAWNSLGVSRWQFSLKPILELSLYWRKPWKWHKMCEIYGKKSTTLREAWKNGRENWGNRRQNVEHGRKVETSSCFTRLHRRRRITATAATDFFSMVNFLRVTRPLKPNLSWFHHHVSRGFFARRRV